MISRHYKVVRRGDTWVVIHEETGETLGTNSDYTEALVQSDALNRAVYTDRWAATDALRSEA